MIDVELPDGRVVSIDTNDRAVASQAAKKFLATAESTKPDKYQQAAIAERDAMKALGLNTGAGITRRLVQGATFNTADEILAGLMTLPEMVKRGTFSPREGYNYAKAREDLILDDSRKNTGVLGTVAEIGGGALSGTGLANVGVTAARALAPGAGIFQRSLASAADAAGYGALSGAMEGNAFNERAKNAVLGSVLGAGVGLAAPAVMGTIGAFASPIVSNIRARTNPEGYARSQVARGIVESGQTPLQIAANVVSAAAEGQPMFTVADAMGNAGQRMLSTTSRSPGAGRTAVVDFVENRQAGQGRRIANALAEGFNSPATANQTREAMTSARNAAADVAYDAARAGAGPVDVSRVIARIDQTLAPGVSNIARPASGLANDSIEGALSNLRAKLTDGRSILTDFTALQRVRADLSDAMQGAERAGQNNKARLLGQAMRELDTSLEAASAGFMQANRNYSAASRAIDAIDEGAVAATRGRVEDTIPRFVGMTPQGQVGFRAGYVDPLIAQSQGAAIGVNKARPLMNDAFVAEANVMAPNAGLMNRRIGRENTMFETRNHAIGGSRTYDNAADAGAMAIDPSLVANVLSGNWGSALRSVMASGQNVMSGNTAAVREQVANILLQRGANIPRNQLMIMLDEAVNRIQMISRLASQIGRGASAGLAVAPSATDGSRR